EVDYKLAANVLGLIVFAVFFALSARRGAEDPVCGVRMRPGDGPLAEYAGRVFNFCSQSCRQRFAQDPARYSAPGRASREARVAAPSHGAGVQSLALARSRRASATPRRKPLTCRGSRSRAESIPAIAASASTESAKAARLSAERSRWRRRK